MMKFLPFLTLFTSFLSLNANACTGPTVSDVKQEFKSAKVVYLAVAANTQQTAIADTNFIDEKSTFKILEVWKGTKKVGDTIIVRSTIGPGECGLSAKNDPAWFENEKSNQSSVISGVWLIYANGDEPYELSMIGRTRPIEFGGANDLRDLYKMTKYKKNK